MRGKKLRVLAMACAAGAFFWLVIHLELSNWDEPIPGEGVVQPAHGTPASSAGTVSVSSATSK